MAIILLMKTGNNTFNENVSSKTSGTFITVMDAPSLYAVLYGN